MRPVHSRTHATPTPSATPRPAPRPALRSGEALRTDATRYRVFAYLAAFRLDELGAAGFWWAASWREGGGAGRTGGVPVLEPCMGCTGSGGH